MFICHDMAYHDWKGFALDLDELKRLVADLGDKDLMVLRNHGTLKLGGSVASWFMRIYLFERPFKIQVRALLSGSPDLPSDRGLV